MAFAALGAAEVLSVDPDDMSARTLLSDAADAMTDPANMRGGRGPSNASPTPTPRSPKR